MFRFAMLLFASFASVSIAISSPLAPLSPQSERTGSPVVVPEPGKQVEQKLELAGGKSIQYLLYLPAEYEPGKPLPLLLFLHGRGESDGPLSLVAKWGPPAMLKAGQSMPMIVVSPQCPASDFWSSAEQQSLLLELLGSVQRQFPVDATRVYLSGLSMGGYGSWALATSSPELFAAVIPVCGKGDPDEAERLVETPVWAWHGVEDRVVPLQHSQEMVDAIRAAGGEKVRLTTLEHVGHNAWSSAYGNPELLEWMLEQRPVVGTRSEGK